MAARIMEQYQISQADIMIHEDASQREKRGGMSAVDIWPAKENGRVFTPGWVDWLLGAVETFFNSIAAEALHNQIVDWSERFTGIQARNSYCLGVADGLLSLSKEEKRNAECQARESEEQALAAKIREEEAQDVGRLSRLHGTPPVPAIRCGFKVNLDVDDSENLNGTMSDTSDTTVLGDVVEDSVEEDSAEEDSVKDTHSAETIIDTEADFDTELQNFMNPERSE
ncbi:MAG: hypothetical protein L6R42_009433, partial [Xanthoria sp. 1 TBL-2021]